MAYTTIDDPSAYFTTVLSTSTGSALTIDTGFKPDWLWTKARNFARSHELHDTTRGDNKRLKSDATTAEESYSNYLAFTSTGATFGTNHNLGYHTEGATTGVSWAWKANGGTTSSNTDGDITTTVQANTTAGFSIATYTGNGGSGQTLGHGLGAAADLIIFKDRESTSAWRTYVRLLGASKFLDLNTTNAANTSTNVFPSASSTTIGVEQNDVMNKSGSNHIMYSFRSIQGYSKIGSYTGNGHATDGPFVYTGFKPSWLLYRNVSRAENWLIEDNKRNTDNPVSGAKLQANVADAETTETRWGFDFLSNGFKVRNTEAQNANNGSGETIIYMAFAESPFVSSEGVPTTAR